MAGPLLNAFMAPENSGALNQSIWDTSPNIAMISAMRGRGLFGALAMKEQAALDKQRQQAANQTVNSILTATPEAPAPSGISDADAQRIGAPWAAASQIPQGPPPSPADVYRHRASLFANKGLLTEANSMADIAKKLDSELEFKDGVWYNKRTGAPVRGGAFVNQQGFGGLMQVGPNGEISAGALPGAANLYAQQVQIGERGKAQYDLQTVPATGPNSQPYFASRLDLLGGGQAPSTPAGAPAAVPPGRTPAGMSPTQTSTVAADAAQQKGVSENFATIYNNLQNASMSNPGKIARLQQVGNLLGDFEGGKFSAAGLELARGFNSAGLKIDPKLPNKEAAIALSNEIALELRSPAGGAGMPGAMSDQDREFLKSMTPQMSQTAEGRKGIIGARVKVMERENQVAGMARQYRQKYGKLDENFFSQLSEWSNRNPIFGKK